MSFQTKQSTALALTAAVAFVASMGCAAPVDAPSDTLVSDAGGIVPRSDAAIVKDASPPPASQQDASDAPTSTGLSIKVVGNQFIDGNGKVVRLLGVNRSGAEFKCIQGGSPGSLGWGIFDGPTDAASADVIASWHATAVRVPLNEDCWLGINGVNPLYAGANYQTAITDYVAALHKAGLYAIVDLHWSSPGTIPAAWQQPLPDADHADDFWKSVATAFASDPAVVFDLYNEPFIYGNYLQNQNEDPWTCWLKGCALTQYITGGSPFTKPAAWNSVGMQTLVDTIRKTGAKNPIMIGGLDWANDLSGWLAHQPQDPQNAIAASWHVYPSEACTSPACRSTVITPIAAKVPVVIGEVGDAVCKSTTLIDSFLPWADSAGISYLGWTWNAWGDCDNVLIANFAGTPTNNYGQRFHDLLMLSNP